MKRPIKFRGKDIDSGQWIYGDFTRPNFYCSKRGLFGEVVSCIWNDKGNSIVAPETVGQFTGLRDKNREEIFEDDIVKYYDDIKDEFINGIVVYSQADCSFIVVTEGREPIALTASRTFEVVGNIHEVEKQ